MKDKNVTEFSFRGTPEGQAILTSIVVGAIVAVIKIAAYLLSGSMAVMSDMMESLVHDLAVAFAAYCLWYSHRPADENHLYGHGKIQFFSAAVEGGLVCAAGVLILVEVLKSFVFGYSLLDITHGVILVILAAVINGILGSYLIYIGKKQNSLIVVANGYHVFSDVVTTGASLVGILLASWTGILFFDQAVAALGALYILYAGMKLIRTSVAGLMDEVDTTADRTIRQVLESEIQEHQWQYHALRHRSEGDRHWVELHLVMNPAASLEEAHDQASHLESEIRKAFGDPVTITTHLEPYNERRRKDAGHAKTI